MKRLFKFYLADGSIASAVSNQDLIDLGVYEERKDHLEANYVSEMYNERLWRNDELRATDNLLPEDATYNGQSVRNTEYYAQIMEYRKAIRDYDLKYMPRPVAPDWF